MVPTTAVKRAKHVVSLDEYHRHGVGRRISFPRPVPDEPVTHTECEKHKPGFLSDEPNIAMSAIQMATDP